MARVLVGLAVGSGLEGVDVALVRAEGSGLDLIPHSLHSARIRFSPAVADSLHQTGITGSNSLSERDVVRYVAEAASHAVRTASLRTGISHRDVFAIGFLEPSHYPAEGVLLWPEVAERLAESTGLTVVAGFRSRDRALGGSGHPITAAADVVGMRNSGECRILVHLGAVASVLVLVPGAKPSEFVGFDIGPGNQLLDALTFHGTRGRDRLDPGGKKAVQGCCNEPLLAHWLDHPHFCRRPPKTLHPEAFGRSFLLDAFETARGLGVGLPDLLCTATHLIASAIARACEPWLTSPHRTRILTSGGGVRNGFMMHLLRHKLSGSSLDSSEVVGLAPLARNATAAGILAAHTCDGVMGNLPHLTGATCGRILGRFIPGDMRNWSRCVNWLADQYADTPRLGRAA